MEEHVKKDLELEEPSDFHRTMLKDCLELIDMSRRKMQEFYPLWDRLDEVYRGQRKPDAADKDAKDRGEPEKMVVPVAYSQVNTFVSFMVNLFTQKERLFELQGTKLEAHKGAKIGEALLQRDLMASGEMQLLFQFFLDIARFGLGIIKSCWVEERKVITKTVQIPPGTFLGFPLGKGREEQVTEEAITFQGNRVSNISPYRFFPDTRVPLTRHQDGEFCASEDEYSYVTLKQWEKNGSIAGLKWVKNIEQKRMEIRKDSRLTSDMVNQSSPTFLKGNGQSKGMFVVTEMQRVVIPNEYMVEGKPLGPEDYPVKYVIWIANDQRLIKCEPMNYAHDLFTYDLQQFTPDMHELMNPTLSESIDSLQSVITWFINSRITSVRKLIQNKLVVDPEGIRMEDLDAHGPVIRLKAGAGRNGIDRWIKQLDLHDVTGNHIQDAEFLHELVQVVTGISENALGQFHAGRRSATEAKNVNAGGTMRLKTVAMLVFYGALVPLGRKMLSNLRDGLSVETAIKVVGLDVAEEGAQFMQVSKADLQSDFDFEIMDGTLPSEKQYIAQVLQEILLGLMSNPEAAIVLGMDPKALLMEMMELRGVRNPKRFTLNPIKPNGPQGAPTGPGNITQLPNVQGVSGQSDVGGLAVNGGGNGGGY